MSHYGNDSSGESDGPGTKLNKSKRPADERDDRGDEESDVDGDVSMDRPDIDGVEPSQSGEVTPGYAASQAGGTTRSGARHGPHVGLTGVGKKPATAAAGTQTPFSFLAEDAEGETKIDQDGNLLGGRQYVCKTFFLPDKDQTLYLLATEVARITGYRDSYLLFHKNKHLVKLMTNDQEKHMMIQQEA